MVVKVVKACINSSLTYGCEVVKACINSSLTYGCESC